MAIVNTKAICDEVVVFFYFEVVDFSEATGSDRFDCFQICIPLWGWNIV